MLPASAEAIERRLAPTDRVLDVGGWYKPFPRADWVLDLMPYETRGAADGRGADGPGAPADGRAADGPGAERFGPETWVRRDICDHAPWPFTDDQFDFAICSHTLEDVRDPVWVCSELNRVARSGYVEVPSRLEEQAWWVNGEWVGWSHHHWLIDVGEDSIEFVFKPHAIHGRPECYFPAPLGGVLTDAERVQTLFWEGGFAYRERIFYELDEFDQYLIGFVSDRRGELESRLPAPSWRARLRGAIANPGRLLRRAP